MRLHFSWVFPLAILLAAGCGGPAGSEAATGPQRPQTEGGRAMSTVPVRVIDSDGNLSEPRDVPAVVLSDVEWRKRLTPQQFRITRGKDTERAFCGGLLKNKTPGMYVCVCCNLPLFESKTKFESGTGWPSFFQPAAKENIREEADTSLGMTRTEILCRRCAAHLGHVPLTTDLPPPAGATA